MSQQALIVRGEYRSESLMNLEEVAHTGGVINIWARARWPETSREASRRTRDRSGRNARSGSCVIITAEGNGKRCGQLSWEEVQVLTASSRGRLTSLTFGAFPDAVRWCSTVWMRAQIICSWGERIWFNLRLLYQLHAHLRGSQIRCDFTRVARRSDGRLASETNVSGDSYHIYPLSPESTEHPNE